MLLPGGKTAPVSSLKPGEKVIATSTRTGKDQPETVAAVEVHHDTDLYDLKVREHGHAAVIHTTSSHLFWVPGSHGHGRWVKAAALRHGTHLRTPGGDGATVTGGYVPRRHDGWMWDLTITPSHDFYVLPDPRTGHHPHYVGARPTAILVHNDNCPTIELNDPSSEISQVAMKARMKNGVEVGRNVAVYQIGSGENARYIAAATQGNMHSERILDAYINQLIKQNKISLQGG